MTIEATTTIGELASSAPLATTILEKFGIDYCCGGKRSIAEACDQAGITVTELTAAIENASTVPVPHQYNGATQRDLVDYILANHHVFTRYELARLSRLLDKVVSVHGERHPELLHVQAIFRALSDELNPHMSKEEMVLFPYVVHLETAGNEGLLEVPPFVTVENPITRMTSEHEKAGDLLNKIRTLTSGFILPQDACISFEMLYRGLEDLEQDLHRHIHLENNVLFPRALQMEQTRRAAAAHHKAC